MLVVLFPPIVVVTLFEFMLLLWWVLSSEFVLELFSFFFVKGHFPANMCHYLETYSEDGEKEMNTPDLSPDIGRSVVPQKNKLENTMRDEQQISGAGHEH